MTPATLNSRDIQLEPRARWNSGPQSFIWCAPNSRTNIIMTMAESIPDSVVPDMFVACFTSIMTHIVVFGDSVVQSGVFNWTVDTLAMHVWDANNHQMTWGVLAGAVHAIEDFMFHQQHWGGANFEIYDGQNIVAQGVLGRPTAGSSSQGSIPG